MFEIRDISTLEQHIVEYRRLFRIAILGLNLTQHSKQLESIEVTESIFLGCILNPTTLLKLSMDNNSIFTQFELPFKIYVSEMYSSHDLYTGFITNDPKSYFDTYDYLIYKYYMKYGGNHTSQIDLTLAYKIHDHGMEDALNDFLRSNYPSEKVVGIMGGHRLSRDSKAYFDIAILSKSLSEKGFVMVTGGGPGAMEATHLGCWMADNPIQQMIEAIEILKEAPLYSDELWLSKAFEVMDRFPSSDKDHIGIPTWSYGHEPPTPFAKHIAKFFTNSIREEGLLSIAKGGIVYAPGSAGTMQEVFQDLTQNHYKTYDIASPMIFYNTDFWTKEVPIYSFLQKMVTDKRLNHIILGLGDHPNDIENQILEYQKNFE